MHRVEFPSQNAMIPASFTSAQGFIPVQYIQGGFLDRQVVQCFRLTWKERWEIFKTGFIWLRTELDSLPLPKQTLHSKEASVKEFYAPQ